MPIQKKKQSRLSSLGAKLKTPKGRLVATFLVFAVIGGGIFVYKSFAATIAWPYDTANKNLTVASKGTCKQSTVWDASFKQDVFVIGCNNNSGSPAYNNASVRTSGAYLPAGYNGKYRICAWVKGVGHVQFLITAVNQNTSYDSYYRDGSNSVFNNSTFQYLCPTQDSAWLPVYKATAIEGSAAVYPGTGINNLVTVGRVVLEKQ